MGRERPFDEFPWSSIRRRRRMTIGDLMIGVIVAALACLTLTAALRSSLGDADRAGLGALVLALVALQTAQWKLASVPAAASNRGRARSWASSHISWE